MTNNLLSRRSLLTGLLVSPVAAMLITRESHGQTPPPSGPFTLAPLPYAPSALEPHIDAQTMTIHHDRHHQTYVNNLNAAVGKYPALAKSSSAVALLKNLDRLPEDIRTAVRNNAGGHVNHTMFWETMTPGGAKMPSGSLGRKISDTFGSFEKFQAAFEDAGAKRFGSGWVWLVDNKGKLEVVSTPNQDHPILDGKKALLGNDVWEHAYYLKYQNKRADYLKAWWNVVNWDIVASRM